MDKRAVHGGDRARNRPSGVQPTGLAKILSDMITSALSWEYAHGIQTDQDINDKDVIGPPRADVSCSPRCNPSPGKDARVGQRGGGDGVQRPAIDV